MNMQLLTQLLAKLPAIPLLLAYVGYLGYDCYQFEFDPGSDLHVKQALVLSAQADVAKLKQKVKEVNDFLASLSIKKQQLRQLAQDLEDTRATVPRTIDDSVVITAILTEAKRSGIHIAEYSHASSVTALEYYSELEFKLRTNGVFFQYVLFLDRLANLQQILRLSGAIFDLPAGVSPDASYVRLNGELHIKAYSYIGTQADEISKTSLAAPGPPSAAGAPKKGGA
jgi:Tfp pilus assembly protein PilO